MRDHGPMNDQGVLALAEKVVEQATEEYVQLWARQLGGEKRLGGRLKTLETFFTESPFMMAVSLPTEEVLQVLRKRGEQEYESRREFYDQKYLGEH